MTTPEQSIHVPSLRRHSSWWLRAVYAVLALGFLWGAWMMIQQHRVTGWPQALAEVVERDGPDDQRFGPLQLRLRCEYQVDGEAYTGDRWSPCPVLIVGLDLRPDNQLLTAETNRTWVRHHPSSPGRSYLLHEGITYFPIFLTVVCGLGLFALFHFEHHYRGGV